MVCRRALLAGIVGMIGFVACSGAPTEPIPGEVAVPLEEPSTGIVTPPERVPYREHAPTSGRHYAAKLSYGIYRDPYGVLPEYWVGNLAEGGVVILYDCPQPCPELYESLRKLHLEAAESKRDGLKKLIVAPYAGLETPLVALAWGRKLPLASFDRDRLLAFYQRYQDQAPPEADVADDIVQ